MSNDDLTSNLPEEPTLDAAEAKTISLPPALVEQIQSAPELLVQLARGQLALVQDRMVRRVLTDPNTTVGAYAQVHDALAKVAFGKGGGAGGESLGGRGPSFQINILRASKKGQGVTIEAEKEVLSIDAEA